MPRPGRLLPATLVALMVLSLCGCGSMTTAPMPSDLNSAPTPMQTESSLAPAQTNGLLGTVIGTVVGTVIKVVGLIGELGGTLTNGRWKLAIPSGALDGMSTVTMTVTDATSPVVELGIMPADRNSFDKPVMLTVDCRNVSSTQLSTYVIYWSDPVNHCWVKVPDSKVDLSKKTVSAPLMHFSKYSVGPDGGKAGW